MLRWLAAVALLTGGSAIAARGPVYVMRHLERGGGIAEDPPLTAAGSADAKRLAGWFSHDPPVAIFVTATRRAHDTAAPLGQHLRLTPRIYDPRDTAALAKSVAAIDGPVLIVGHSNTVPGLVAVFGAPPPPELEDDDYGRIWIVSRGAVVQVAKLREPQPQKPKT